MTLGHPSLHDLLVIEDDAAILGFRCPDTGYLTWPLLRNQFLRALISQLYYGDAALVAPPPAGRHRRALVALPKTLWRNARQWSDMRSDILIMASGAGHFPRQGRSFNRITDYFAGQRMAQTRTIEGLMDWQVPARTWNTRTSYYLPWQGAMLLRARLNRKPRHAAHARELVAFVNARAVDRLGVRLSAAQLGVLVERVAAKLSQLPAMAGTYRSLFDRVRPRLLLLEQACYSDHGVFNQVAREAGVRVAEPQHGMITGGHDAYNYAPTVRDSEAFRACLPHDLLTYGPWWGAQADAPVRKRSIGHPHYIEQTRVLDHGQEKTDILLLSDGFEFGKYLDLGRDLHARLGSRFRVVVRPHPIERVQVRATHGTSAGGVFIDQQPDIYASFASAFAVAGEVSTGLFEAVGLARHVVLWATPKGRFSFPSHPFLECETSEALADLLLTRRPDDEGLDMAEIWATDWQGNYDRYLEEVLGNGESGKGGA